MRNGILILSFVGVVSLTTWAQAEIFEVPLPLGEYRYNDRRNFSFDLGTELSEIHSVQFRSQGSMVAPLGGPEWGPFTTPLDGVFVATLFTDGPVAAPMYSPTAGKATYPDPEPFSGVYTPSAPASAWSSFLLDGKADGFVRFGRGDPAPGAAGGLGVLTGATLIIDATAVPEPAAAVFLSLSLHPLLRRRRRA